MPNVPLLVAGAQCAHAAIGVVLQLLAADVSLYQRWEQCGQRKIVVKVQDAQCMVSVVQQVTCQSLANRTEAAACSKSMQDQKQHMFRNPNSLQGGLLHSMQCLDAKDGKMQERWQRQLEQLALDVASSASVRCHRLMLNTAEFREARAGASRCQ
jgi:hypothetical protein